jgi:hypothetical protein
MGWFRSHRRLAGWVALVALLVQLGLAFGHEHALSHGDRAVFAATPNTQPVSGDTDDYCAICAVQAMLSGAQTASAPAAAPPVALASAEISPAAAPLAASTPAAAFRSRAPPLS